MKLEDLFTIELLITSGVLGYLSYWLLRKRGRIVTSGTEDVVASLLFLSFWIYILMWLLYQLFTWNRGLNLPEEWASLWSLVIAIIISLFLSWIFPTKLANWINRRIDIRRKSEGQAGYSAFTARYHFFNHDEKMMVFVFDFENNLITNGYCTVINENQDDDFEMIVTPFNEPSHLKTHEDILGYIEDIRIKSEILIDFEQKLKFYKIREP